MQFTGTDGRQRVIDFDECFSTALGRDLQRTEAKSTMSAVFTYTDCCLPSHSTTSPASTPSVA
jgi:hypothetical protein